MFSWQVQKQGSNFQANPAAQTTLDGPVLSCCFSPDGSQVFAGGADNTVRMWQLGPQTTAQRIGTHDAPVKQVCFYPQHNLVVSGGWDNCFKFWDIRQQREAHRQPVPNKVLAMDVRDSLMAVAVSDSNAAPQVYLYSLAKGTPELWNNTFIPSSLKHQPRCISLFPTGRPAYLLGSTEGRVEIQDLEFPHDKKKTFAFKCHRVQSKTGQSRSLVYPVNALTWHPNGIFATAGSDGAFSFWDKEKKQKLIEFKAGSHCRTGQTDQPISAAKFNSQGDVFVYATSYDWHKGREYNTNKASDVYLHAVQPDELVAKPKTR